MDPDKKTTTLQDVADAINDAFRNEFGACWMTVGDHLFDERTGEVRTELDIELFEQDMRELRFLDQPSTMSYAHAREIREGKGADPHGSFADHRAAFPELVDWAEWRYKRFLKGSYWLFYHSNGSRVDHRVTKRRAIVLYAELCDFLRDHNSDLLARVTAENCPGLDKEYARDNLISRLVRLDKKPD